MEFKKEDLERLIFIEKRTYVEISNIYGVSDTYIKKISRKLGINLEIRSHFSPNFKPHNHGYALPRNKCKNCNVIIENVKTIKQLFCEKECELEYRVNEKYNHYLSNQIEYCYDRNMGFIKKHLALEQNNKCYICDCDNKWNGKNLVFILDHIDGNASNNLRNNLRLVCPNCDSQLDTYKSKNKNSARKDRYKKK